MTHAPKPTRWTRAKLDRAGQRTKLQAALDAGIETVAPLNGIYVKIMLAAHEKYGLTLTADEIRTLSLDWAVSEAADNGVHEILLGELVSRK